VICSNCGTENRAGRRFCGNCGTALANICTNCGARNKPKWEFCVKCSESLQGIPLGEDAPPTDAAPVESLETEPFPWTSLASFAVLLALAVMSFQYFSQPAVAPPPELFSIGTLRRISPVRRSQTRSWKSPHGAASSSPLGEKAMA